MASKIKRTITKIFSHRMLLLLAVFLVMSLILTFRIFQLQIVHGQEYADNFTLTTTRTRTLKSTRGNIYDVYGRLLAYNELANSITLEDNGTYDTRRNKQLALNGEIYRVIQIIEECGSQPDDNFHIDLDDNGNYIFDISEGVTLRRFRADIFGYKSASDMSPEELASTPSELMELLCGSSYFGLENEENPYTEEELTANGLPLHLTDKEKLEIVRVRYQLFLTGYQKYVQVTIASNVNDETVAAIEENLDSLQGVAVSEDSIRVYNYAEAMAPIIGYTGKPSAEELEELQQQRADYTSNSIIGKSGMEKYMETTLQGVNGSEDVAVDNLGKVLEIYEDSRVEPTQGDNVYLTIDAELQEACYKVLEQRIAGIIVSNMVNIRYEEELGQDPDDSSYTVPITAYEVYSSLFTNSFIDIGHFESLEASTAEKNAYSLFEICQTSIFQWLRSEITASAPTKFSELNEEHQDYISYVIDDILTDETGVIVPQGNYTEEEVYKQWQTGDITAHDYLAFAVSSNWVDLTKITDSETFLSTTEVYMAISDFLENYLSTDTEFSKKLYKYMLYNDVIYPQDVVQIIYDQQLIPADDEDYTAYKAGTMTPYDFIKAKISKLQITPANLALDPCSGSMVITDPTTGYTKALVSYPGYDNNRLANTMDTDYYWKLYEDDSTPFYNKATQQLTAPGSTFKPVMVTAGLTEGVIDDNTIINCNGLFGEGLVDESDQLHCMVLTGHGDENVTLALSNSCNVFFCTVGYLMGITDEGTFSSNLAIQKIQHYASMLNLDAGTNIQMTESDPHVSDSMAIPSSIGQGTHLYTTTQLARFAQTLYNNGISYDLGLLHKITTNSGTNLNTFLPVVSKTAEFSDNVWKDIKEGMRGVITNSAVFGKDFPIELYGKTGTAEESSNRPSHALFMGFCRYQGMGSLSFAVRIAYGYSSQNAMTVAKDVLQYYYGLADKSDIITGTAHTDYLTSIVTD